MTGPVLLAHTSFVHEPEGDLLVGMGLGSRLYGAGEAPLANASAALAPRWGCTGRAFGLDSPRRRTPRDMDCGPMLLLPLGETLRSTTVRAVHPSCQSLR